MKFKVLGKAWSLKILKDEDYDKLHGSDSVAITHTDKKIIYLSHTGTDRGTLTHELVHAYISEMCLSTSHGPFSVFEEFFAEFMAKHAKELLDLSEALMYRIESRRNKCATKQLIPE